MISAYGIDNNGFKTNIYETKVSTGEEALPTINSVTVSDVTYDSIKINVNGSDGITSYEYSINGGESLINQNAEYTFSDLKTGVNYEIKVRGKTEEEVYSSTYVINTKIPIIGEICKGQEMSKCIKENYKLDSNINYHNVEAAEADGIENYDKVAGDDSYRYSGADGEVKNYVCLDGTTTGTTCADADLYRIIGIFKNEQEQYEMKLIKATPATTTELGDSTAKADGENSELPSAYASGRGYYWNSSLGTDSSANNVNMWKESNLNKVNLNSFYYKYMTETKGLTNKIADHTWVVGNNWSGGNAKEVYDNEVGTKKLTSSSKNCYNQGNIIEKRECNLDNDIIYPAKIGLMYISDYMYGTSATNWTTIATNYKNDEVKNNNWLYIGASEWTISRLSENDDITRIVNYTGTAYSNGSVYSYNVVRPTFYLTSDTKLASGKGTKEEPFRFELN